MGRAKASQSPLNLAGQWCEPCARYLYGGHGLQRMTFATWQAAIAAEAQPTRRTGGDMPFDDMLAYLARLSEPRT